MESPENLMHQTGLFTPDEIRVANEGKLRARWKLGRLLAKAERTHPGPRGKTDKSAGLTQLLVRLELDRQTALEAQRIGTLPPAELEKALSFYRASIYYATFSPADEGRQSASHSASRRRRSHYSI